MSRNKIGKSPFKVPLLLILAVLIILGMLRLGVWQLDRASEKQQILDQVMARANSPLLDLTSAEQPSRDIDVSDMRFQPVIALGKYIAEHSLLIENQVVNKRVGYQVVTPFKLKGSDQVVMISRGWAPAGLTREELPIVTTPTGEVELSGRLNLPPAQPPLWKEGYPVNEGPVWQYLPIDEFASQIEAQVMPLVIELAPDQAGTEDLIVQWQAINDKWVAKHKGYAFQWFSMSFAFLVACLILLISSSRSKGEKRQ